MQTTWDCDSQSLTERLFVQAMATREELQRQSSILPACFGGSFISLDLAHNIVSRRILWIAGVYLHMDMFRKSDWSAC